MEVGQPTQLAKLPRAGLHGDGTAHFCQVYAVQDGNRKKRQEICAAVDGDSVNIIEVVNGRNLASWPVPPDVTFLCDPYSEKVKAKDGSVHRRTWCAGRRRDLDFVECYEEIKTNETTSHLTMSCSISASKAKIVSLQPFGSEAVMLIHENGSITTVLYRKDTPHSEAILQGSPKISKILTAQVLTMDAAKTSVLKSRPDLISTRPQNNHEMVVVAVYTSPDGLQERRPLPVHIGIWSLDARRGTGYNARVEPLATYKFECSAIKMTAATRARFTSDTRGLHISDNMSTMYFDLTTTYARHVATRKHLVNDALTEIELASNIFLSISSENLQVYNASFGSILASSSRNKKRRRDSSRSAELVIIAYISQLKRVVVCEQRSIYAIDIHTTTTIARPFQKSSLLIGNILRGASNDALTTDTNSRTVSHFGKVKSGQLPFHWQTQQKELDLLAAERNAQGFERKLLQVFDQNSFSDLRRSRVPMKIIEYIMRKIFGISQVKPDFGDHSNQLKVIFMVPDLLRWLIRYGFLEDGQVVRALKMESIISTSSTGLVARALLDVDADQQMVQEYVTRSPHIDSVQLCSIIKPLLTTAVAASDKIVHKQLRHELKVEMDEVADPKAIVVGVGPDELTVSTSTTICLSLALKRLALVGPGTISKDFRKLFSQLEILAIIQFVRQQLFLGGYTRLVENWKPHGSTTPNIDDAEEQRTNPNPQIPLEDLVLLLNGCVDALGSVGLLGSEEHEDFIQELLPDLLSEITSATKAVEDSTFLQGLVRETLRYAESFETQPFEVRSRIQKESHSSNRRGEVVTLYAEPDTEETGVMTGSALPLSLKGVENISKFKVRKGGGQVYRRSAREMGMLKDRLKSNYAFERLIL